eukprot:TRINITY_DN11757_c0_g1_i1.p1 TRINITY_DN11757_c0_g1~~TRINITY_DN11757_c0_g1_i1.p1  ORF type:complete len:666 (+),score=69.19 TRINITY_DN11757_c0_g1_i1:50-2047(+)
MSRLFSPSPRFIVLLICIAPVLVIAVPTLLPPNVSAGAYLTATDFGADPTGFNDAQVALQNALVQAKTQKKALYIPSGFYNHSNVLVVDSVVVFGDGDSTIVYANSTDYSALQLVGNNSALYYMWVSGNPHLRENGQPHWNLVWGYHAKNITVKSIRVSPLDGVGEARQTGDHLGVWGTGGVFLYDVDGGVVADNTVDWTVADSIHMTACSKNLQILRNVIGHSGDDTIAMVTYGVGPNTCFVQQIEIAENYGHNGIYSRGITCIGCRDALIRDNVIVNSTNAAIWLSSETSYNTSCWHNVRVVRNRMIRTGYLFNSGDCSPSTLPASGIDRSNPLDTCEDVYFADNVIQDCCRQGFRVSGSGSAGVSGGLVFVGNTISMAKASGIWIAGNHFDALMFGGNTVSNVGSEGLVVSGGNNSVYIDRHSVADHAQTTKLSAYAYYSTPIDYQVTFSNHTMDSGKAYIWSVQMQFAAERLAVSNNTFPSNYGAYNGTGVTRLLGPTSTTSLDLPRAPRQLSIRLERSQTTSGYDVPVSVFASQVSDNSYVVAAFGGIGGNVTISQDRTRMQFTSKSQCYSYCAFSVLFYKPGGGISTSTVEIQLYDAPTVVNTPPSSGSASPTNPVSPSLAQPSAKSAAPKATSASWTFSASNHSYVAFLVCTLLFLAI